MSRDKAPGPVLPGATTRQLERLTGVSREWDKAPDPVPASGTRWLRYGKLAFRAYHALYEKCLRLAGGIEMRAQAAIRIAKLVSDRGNAEWGIPYDPMRALELYQLAERGLRVDIAHGQTYYKKRLQEALDGQDRMRELLNGPLCRL